MLHTGPGPFINSGIDSRIRWFMTYRNAISRLALLSVVLMPGLCSCTTPAGRVGEEDSDRFPRYEGELRIGLALGSGGANGLAHIAMLEVFDELGIRPHRIAGSSIGAVIGALYASGKSAAEIRELVADLVVQESDTWQEVLLERQMLEWLRFVDPDIGRGGLINGEAFMLFLQGAVERTTFEELRIPLTVVTTDLWKREQVLHHSGDLFAPIQASMAIPGLFTPVTIGERVLIDGGLMNPLPYDLLFDSCDVIVAVNVIGKTSPKDDLSFLDTTFMTMRIMQSALVEEKRERREPHIFIDAGIYDVRTLHYHKLDDILEQAQAAKRELRAKLIRLLSTTGRQP